MCSYVQREEITFFCDSLRLHKCSTASLLFFPFVRAFISSEDFDHRICRLLRCSLDSRICLAFALFLSSVSSAFEITYDSPEADVIEIIQVNDSREQQARNDFSDLTDAQETELGSDLLLQDTDDDGVNDGKDAFATNAAAFLDEDEDGLPDVWARGCYASCQGDSGLTLDPDFAPVEEISCPGVACPSWSRGWRTATLSSLQEPYTVQDMVG